jgi:hypothetical protein
LANQEAEMLQKCIPYLRKKEARETLNDCIRDWNFAARFFLPMQEKKINVDPVVLAAEAEVAHG